MSSVNDIAEVDTIIESLGYFILHYQLLEDSVAHLKYEIII